MGFLSDLVGGVFNPLGFAADMLQGYTNNYYNKKAASTSNRYANEMRSTAHQVEVADLRKAGLNPVLSALGNGASTVAVPHGTNPVTGHNSTAQESWQQKKLQRQLMTAEIANQNAQLELVQANSAKARAEAEKTKKEAERVGQVEQSFYDINKVLKYAMRFWDWNWNRDQREAQQQRNNARHPQIDWKDVKVVPEPVKPRGKERNIFFFNGKPYLLDKDGKMKSME